MQMKIGILTHYNVSSHGALLQMYALKSELEAMGHTVFILTYNRNLDFIDEETRKRFSASIRNLPYYLKTYMIQNGLPMMLYQYKKQKILGKFRAENFTLRPYVESRELDCVVVGADETFALENGVNFVMFGHGITSPKLIAYAPSFGQTDAKRIDSFGCRELISSGLAKFDSLAVRDRGSQKTVQDMIGKDVQVVCDPALLHDFGPIKKGTDAKRYIVVYSYQSNFKEADRIAKIKEYAKRNNCELWSVGVYYKWCDKQINCGPLEMIQVFANAQAVFTDTFHGTITSYIAKTPMAVFYRSNNNVKLNDLLETLGIMDRRITSPEQLDDVMAQTVDFAQMDSRVAALRRSGHKYLEEALR